MAHRKDQKVNYTDIVELNSLGKLFKIDCDFGLACHIPLSAMDKQTN